MRLIARIHMAFLSLFRRGHASAHLDSELRYHLERQIAENIANGMPPNEARHSALRTFGNPALLRDQARATWNGALVESVLRDARLGARTLMRTPGFTMIAIFVMALGIGANVALFTVVRSVLLKPLAFKDSGQLVTLYEADSHRKGAHKNLPVDAGSFAVWQSATRNIADMTMVSPWMDYNISAEGGKLPEKARAAWCSWNFFSVLGVSPALGRTFTPQDDSPDAEATAILSECSLDAAL